MRKTWFWFSVPALILLSILVYLLIAGEKDAGRVRNEVVRFHVIANSNDEADQELKLKVRDGVFALIEELFADCTDQSQALETARRNETLLAAAGEQILRENGNDAPVSVEVGPRFFPTREYGDLSFPAGSYQTVSIEIGNANGKNFWCVLYPALCIAPAVAAQEAEQEMAAIVGEDSTAFLKKTDEKQQIKFVLVEWFEWIKQKFKKS